jgi:hypothetical protein
MKKVKWIGTMQSNQANERMQKEKRLNGLEPSSQINARKKKVKQIEPMRTDLRRLERGNEKCSID